MNPSITDFQRQTPRFAWACRLCGALLGLLAGMPAVAAAEDVRTLPQPAESAPEARTADPHTGLAGERDARRLVGTAWTAPAARPRPDIPARPAPQASDCP